MNNVPKKPKQVFDPAVCRWVSNFITKPAHEKKQILLQVMTQYNAFVDLHKQLYIKSPNEAPNLYTEIYKQRKSIQSQSLGNAKRIESRKMSNQSISVENVSKNEDELMSTFRSVSNYEVLKNEEMEQVSSRLKQTEQQLQDKKCLISKLEDDKKCLIIHQNRMMQKYKNGMGILRKQLKSMKNQFQTISVQMKTMQTKFMDISSFVHQQLRLYGQKLLKSQGQKYMSIVRQYKVKAEEQKINKQKDRIQVIQKLKQIQQIIDRQDKKQNQQKRQKIKQKQTSQEGAKSPIQITCIILSKLKLLLETKQPKQINYQEIIYNNPSIFFIYSNIIPTLKPNTTELHKFLLSNVNNLYKNKKVKSIKPLYSYQPYKDTKFNIHFFLNDISNLLLIIKLKNQTVIGAYSQAGIERKKSSNLSVGFICQSVNKKVFLPRSKYKQNPIMPYDEYFIIIGNHDIIIRMQSDKIQSCFGTETSLFRPNGDFGYDDILHEGPDTDKTLLQDYEFYQLFIF